MALNRNRFNLDDDRDYPIEKPDSTDFKAGRQVSNTEKGMDSLFFGKPAPRRPTNPTNPTQEQANSNRVNAPTTQTGTSSNQARHSDRPAQSATRKE